MLKKILALMIILLLLPLAGAEELSGYDASALFAEESDAGALPVSPGLEIFFLDLGRVDGILIRCEGVDSFIDVGERKHAGPGIEYLEQLGVEHLDSYICSHAHADHIEGGPPIIRKYGADRIYMPHSRCYSQLLEFARDSEKSAVKQAKRVILEAGDSFKIGGATVYCYGPVSVKRCSPGSQAENQNSLLLKLVYGERSFLLTGDATASEIEAAARKYGKDLHADVLKNPHHNGKLDASVVKRINPKVTVFCTADDHQPAREYLSTLKSLGSRYYITGSHHDGNIKLASDGRSLEVTRGYSLTSLTLKDVDTLGVGQTVSLSGSVKPTKYAKWASALNWQSSDTRVAKVSGGRLKAVGEGSCTVTVSAFNGIAASVEVNVLSYGAELNKKRLEMAVGDSAKLKYRLTVKGETAQANWVSSDESVAFVTEEGEVIATHSGTTEIGVEMPNGASAMCQVTVTETKVTRVKLNRHSLKLSAGEQAALKASLQPEDATNKNLRWASSDEDVATVDAFGNVTAVGKGKCRIAAKAASGKYDVCEVQVK